MGFLQSIEQGIGGILGFPQQQQAPAQQGGISVTNAQGQTVDPYANGLIAQNAGSVGANPSQMIGILGSGAPPMAMPTPSAPNATLGAVDRLLFGGAFGAAQRDALSRRMAQYQAQQLGAYGQSLPPDQQRAFYADPQGYIKTQEDIKKTTDSGVKLSDNSLSFGGPTGTVLQAGSQGINDSTNKPYTWQPNVTNLGTGQTAGGNFQAGPAIGSGAPTASNGLVLGKPTDAAPTGVMGTYSTTTGTPLPGQSMTSSPSVNWAPNGQPPGPPQPPSPNRPSNQPDSQLTFQPPVQGPVTSGFGTRPRPTAGATINHMGIDYGVPVGTPVKAAADGVVVSAGPKGGYGNAVVLKHPDGSTTLYGHLSGASVQPGQAVKGGQPIGASGSTGAVTGPNLHYAHFDPSGHPVNPLAPYAAHRQAFQQSQGPANIPGSVSMSGGALGNRFSVVDGGSVPGGKPGERWTVDNLGVEKPTPLPGGFTMDTVQGNRSNFYKSEQYKNATENLAPIKGLFDTISSVAPSGVMSVAALDTLNKSLNPGGVVRPQTVNLFLDHMGLPAEVDSHIRNMFGKGFLSPEVISQIGRASWLYARAHISQAQDMAAKDTQLATQHGYQPTDVGESAPQVPDVPKWAQDTPPPVGQRKEGMVVWSPKGPVKWDSMHKGWVPQ